MEHANATYFPSQNENNCNGNPDKMDKQKLHVKYYYVESITMDNKD